MDTKDMSPIEIQGDEAGCCYLAYRGGHTVASFDNLDDARRFAASEELLECLKVVAADEWIDLSVNEQEKWLKRSAAIITRATWEQS
jgi:hypothetical protein